ncbi:MAG: hypothetical protein V8T90_05045 [Victivallales bacterium]
MADTSHDEIKLLDRGEFSTTVNVQEKRLTRNIRIVSVYSAVFFAIWLVVTGIFHVEIPVLIIGFVICGYLVEATQCLQEPTDLLCPNCAQPLLLVFDWKTGSSPWRSKSIRHLLASGRCSYCRKEIFQDTPEIQPTLSVKELQGGKDNALMLEIFLLIPVLGMIVLMVTSLAASESEMQPSFPLVCIGIAFFELLISLWILLDSFDRTYASPLPCPVCNRDLSKGNLRAIARETGGCGYCGARIVADFQEENEPDCSDTTRQQLLRNRRKEGRAAIISGAVFFTVALLVIAGVWTLAFRLPEIGIKTPAMILSVQDSEKSFSYIYRFDTKRGKSQIVKSHRRDNILQGKKYPVIYWRHAPSFHMLNGQRTENFLMIATFAALFGIMGLAFIFLGCWTRRGNGLVHAGNRFIRLHPGEILADHFPDEEECAKLRKTTINMSLRKANRLSPNLKYGWVICLLFAAGGIASGIKLISLSRLFGAEDIRHHNILVSGGIVCFVFSAGLLIYTVWDLAKQRKAPPPSPADGKGAGE